MLVIDGPLLAEFLATHDLVRMQLINNDEGGRSAFLIIGSSTLNLKYLIRTHEFTLQVFVVADGVLGYGVYVPDGAEHEPLLWSVAESEQELSLLAHAVVGGPVSVALMAEDAINVAKCKARASECDLGMRELFENVDAGSGAAQEFSKSAERALDALNGKRRVRGVAATCRIRLDAEWDELESIYLAQQGRGTINIFSSDEGPQQESIAAFLLDTLAPSGVYRSPRLRDSKNRRELTDLLLTYDNGDILIESKAIGLLARSPLPSREKLTNDTVKHIREASKQLAGAARRVAKGSVVVEDSPEARIIGLHPDQPLHLIVLVSALELIDGRDDFGPEFGLRMMKEPSAFFHILDPAQLIRVVAAAQYFAARTNLSRMELFDSLLIRRAEHAVTVGHPYFDLRFLPSGA